MSNQNSDDDAGHLGDRSVDDLDGADSPATESLGAFGLIMIALHNLLDRFQIRGALGKSGSQKLWIILHQQGAFQIAGTRSPVVLVLYPLIPWIGVMAVGYAFGSLYKKGPAERKRLLVTIGLIAVGLFFVIRGINIYGDPGGWS